MSKMMLNIISLSPAYKIIYPFYRLGLYYENIVYA